MICRTWHGWTTPENADAYDSLLGEEIFQGIAARKLLLRFDDRSTHYEVRERRQA